LSADCREAGNNAAYNVGVELRLSKCFGNAGGNLVAQAKSVLPAL